MPLNEMQFILAVPEARQDFMDFLRSEFSAENVECWTECMKYKADPSKTKALDIIDRFVRLGGDQQVNLPAQLQAQLMGVAAQYQALQGTANPMGFSKRHLTAGLRKADAHVFDGLVTEIEELLRRDSLRRFAATPAGAAWPARYQEASAAMPGHPDLYFRVQEKGRALRARVGL